MHSYVFSHYHIIINNFKYIGIDCGDLSDIPNGNVVIAPDTSLGSTATYSCDAGFNLVGEDTRTCQTNGEWSGEEPSCARKLFVP